MALGYLLALCLNPDHQAWWAIAQQGHRVLSRGQPTACTYEQASASLRCHSGSLVQIKDSSAVVLFSLVCFLQPWGLNQGCATSVVPPSLFVFF